jgi:DNA-binding LytR/AlgR family response regulator
LIDKRVSRSDDSVNRNSAPRPDSSGPAGPEIGNTDPFLHPRSPNLYGLRQQVEHLFDGPTTAADGQPFDHLRDQYEQNDHECRERLSNGHRRDQGNGHRKPHRHTPLPKRFERLPIDREAAAENGGCSDPGIPRNRKGPHRGYQCRNANQNQIGRFEGAAFTFVRLGFSMLWPCRIALRRGMGLMLIGRHRHFVKSVHAMQSGMRLLLPTDAPDTGRTGPDERRKGRDDRLLFMLPVRARSLPFSRRWRFGGRHASENPADFESLVLNRVLRRRLNVLVVEQEDLARESLCGDLTRFSFVDNVRPADSEQAAEQILSYYRPDVIFLDLQLPDFGAFRIVDRSWPKGIPLIVCTTSFDRPLLAALTRCRAAHVVRPVGSQELAYLITTGRRPDPVHPADNLGRILDAASSLEYPVRSRVCAFREGRAFAIETKDIAAIRYDRGQFRLWTRSGVYETPRPLHEMQGNADGASFRLVYRNAFINTDWERFGHHLHRARWWLRWCSLVDYVLDRPLMPSGATENTKGTRRA